MYFDSLSAEDLDMDTGIVIRELMLFVLGFHECIIEIKHNSYKSIIHKKYYFS